MRKNNEYMDKINEKIASNFKEIRIKKNLTQRAMGEILDVSFQQVQKYEKGGTSSIAADKLYYLACMLDINIKDFFKNIDFKKEDVKIKEKGTYYVEW